MADLAQKLRAALAGALEAGEELHGTCIATQSSLFKGRAVALGVTDGRLIVQPLTRRLDPDGAAIALPPERIASADAEGISGGWPNLGAAIMDRAAVTLTVKTTDGEKLKLMMMRGEGPLGLGELGGGETQRQGVQAIGEWFVLHPGPTGG